MDAARRTESDDVSQADLRTLDLPGFEPRGALVADLRFGDLTLRVIAAHLGLLKTSRRAQAQQLDSRLLYYVRASVLWSALDAYTAADPLRLLEESSTRRAPLDPAVVLIDEIDKAPRDFPNDILAEIERYEFQIKEQDNYTVRRDGQQRVVVIMTSNSEKNLPDAFLRRCVFYHIPFPDQAALLAIAKTQLGEATKFTDDLLRSLIEKFRQVRQQAVRKPPATAELVAWLRILEMRDIMHKAPGEQNEYLRDHLSVLVKTKEDLDAMQGIF